MKYLMIISLLTVFLAGCSLWSGSESDKIKPVQAGADGTDVKIMYQVDVINHLDDVVDSIRYQACGQAAEMLTLAENLKPKQRVTVNVHEACVTLKAFNAFNDELKAISDLQLSKNNRWEIK